MVEDGSGRGKNERMPHEGSRKEGHTNFRKGRVAVLPLPAIESVHEFGRARHHSDGQAASDHFSVRGEVGANAEVGLCSARLDTKTRHDFVEDQRSPNVLGHAAKFVKKFFGLQIEVAALHRLDQDRGDLRAPRAKNVEGLWIAIVEDNDLADSARGHTRSNRCRARFAVHG